MPGGTLTFTVMPLTLIDWLPLPAADPSAGDSMGGVDAAASECKIEALAVPLTERAPRPLIALPIWLERLVSVARIGGMPAFRPLWSPCMIAWPCG